MNEGGEALLPFEQKIGFSETACGLAKRADAVCSGREAKIGFFERDDQGNDRSSDDVYRQQKIDEFKRTVNQLAGLSGQEKEGLTKILDAVYRPQKLSSEIEKLLTPSGKFAGIFVNVLGGEGQNGEASALAMVAFLDYVKANPNLPHDQLLKEAFQQVEKVIAAYRQQLPQGEKADYSLAAALVSKDGEVKIINTGDQQVVIFDKYGVRKGSFGEGKEADSTPMVQSTQMENGEKIVLCSKAAVSKIDGTKKVGEIVGELVSKHHSASAGEGEKKETTVSKPIEASVIIPEGEVKDVLRTLAHHFPLIEDNPDNIRDTVSFEEVKRAASVPKPDDSEKVKDLRERMRKINEFLSNPEVQQTLSTLLPDESDSAYRRRVLELLINDQDGRLVFVGDYVKKKDPLFTQLINQGLISEVETSRLLQTAEALYYLEVDKQNRQKLAEYQVDQSTQIPKPKLEEIPVVIYPKRWKEGGEPWVKRGKRIVQTEATAEAEEEGKKGEEPEGPPPGPAVETPAQVEVLPTAPVLEELPPGEPGEKGEGLAPASVVRPPEELETNVILGAAALQDRRTQNVLQMAEHLFSHDLQRMPVPRYARIPILGGILWGLRHPVKMIWQNGLARSVFEQQWIRFSADVQAIVKQAYDQSVPIEVTPELLEKALDEGKAERGRKHILKRALWKVTDFLQGLTGIGQTSEQRLAKQWLENEISKTQDQWNPELQRISQRVLAEQTKLGERYAELPAGISLDEANRLILARDAGETRHELPGNLREPFNQRIKGFIEQFADGDLTEEQLVAQVNAYLLGDLKNSLPSNLQKEFGASEVASNILTLARNVKDNWQRYKIETGESGKSKWEEYQVRLLFGKGEWGGVRGKKEMGFLAERLARRLSERPDWSSGAVAGGAALASDFLSNAAYFAAGYGLSSLKFASNMPLRIVGGLLGVGIGAGFKETGIGLSALGIKGIKGRYLREIEQLSREAARGRLNPNDARIRTEMESALVKREKATVLAQNIERLSNKEGELTEAEAKQLLVYLANADARMRLSDLSGRREVRFKVQNFIEFTEGYENEEYRKLKGALLNGMVRLQCYASANPSFTQGKPLFTVTGIQYGQAGQLGLFDQYSAFIEAQLTVSSDEAKIAEWLKSQLKFSQAEVDQMMQNIYRLLPEMRLGIQKEESLRGKEGLIRRLAAKRGVKKVCQAVATGAVAPLVYGIPMAAAAEVPAVFHDIAHAGGLSHLGAGIQEYLSDWGQVLKGDVPIEVDKAGNWQIDLSPMQRAVYQTPYIAYNLSQQVGLDRILHFSFSSEKVPLPHGEIELPVGFHLQQGDFNHDGVVDTAIINRTTGEFALGLPGLQLDVKDINHDGTLDLIFTDGKGGEIPAEGVLKTLGISSSISEKIVGSHPETVFSLPGGTHPEIIGGIKVETPDGTKWVDNHDGTYDLVGKDIHGKTVVLINDAKVASGALVIDPSKVNSSFHHALNPIGGEEIKTGEEAVEFWQDLLKPRPEKQVWWSNATPTSDYQELRLDNEVYRDANGNLGVHFIGPTGQGSIDGVNFYQVDQVASQHGGMQLAIFVPGLGHLKIDMSSDGKGSDHDFWLDTTNNNIATSDGVPIMMPDGHQATIAELAKIVINQKELADHLQKGGINVGVAPVSLASEWRAREDPSWLDIFNIGNNGHNGHLVAGYTDNGVFNHLATIRGNGDLVGIGEGREFILNLTGSITQQVEDKIGIVSLTPPPSSIPLPFILPIPSRENIERSIRGEAKPEAPAEKSAVVTPRQPVAAPPKTTTPLTPPVKSPEELAKTIGIEPEQLSEALKKQYEKEVIPAIQNFQEAIRSGDEKGITKAKENLTFALGRFNQAARGDSTYTSSKTPQELVAELEATLQGEQGKPKIEQLKQRQKELTKRLDELTKQILQQPNQRPTPQQEQELEQLSRELAENEAELLILQGQEYKLTKEDYEQFKNFWDKLISTKDLQEVNRELEGNGFSKITQQDLEKYKREPAERRAFIGKLLLADVERAITWSIKRGLDTRAFLDLPENEKKALRKGNKIMMLTAQQQQLQNQLSAATKDNDRREIQEQIDSINKIIKAAQDELQALIQSEGLDLDQIRQKIKTKAEEIFNQQYKPQVEAKIEQVGEQIGAWEAEAGIGVAEVKIDLRQEVKTLMEEIEQRKF